MFSKFEGYLDLIQNEAYSSSTYKRSSQEKIRASSGSIAISLAKKANDPMYHRMIMYKTMYKKLKEQLIRKYKSKSLLQARKKASSYSNRGKK